MGPNLVRKSQCFADPVQAVFQLISAIGIKGKGGLIAISRPDEAGYSQSGQVFTWKVGGEWAPIPDVRFRATRSRDIRGPNAVELFNTQTQTTSNVVYQGVTTQAVFQQSGWWPGG